MAVFISYASQDRPALDNLLSGLHRAHQEAWLDEEFRGGETWWNVILEQIRNCDVFIVAMSNHSLASKPCRAELEYAQALQRPILPVQIGPVDSIRVNPLAMVQVIDYRSPSVDAGIQLISAVNDYRETRAPLPDPLPAEPPVPYEYLMRLAKVLEENDLSPRQQTELLGELKSGLEEDGADPTVRRDITQLFNMLRSRQDVTWKTRNDIDSTLASIGSDPPTSSGSVQSGTATPAPPPSGGPQSQQPWTPSPPPQSFGPPSGPLPTPQPFAAASNKDVWRQGVPDKKRSLKPWIIAGSAAAAAAVVIVVGVVLLIPSPPPPPPPPPRLVSADQGQLKEILLTGDEINTTMGASNVQISGQPFTQLQDDQVNVDRSCMGAVYPVETSVYTGTGFTATRGEVWREPGDSFDHFVDQAVVTFPSADQARTFLNDSATKWNTCAGKIATTTSNGQTFRWTLGNVAGAYPKITLTKTQENASGWACQRALSTQFNLVFDVSACVNNVSDQGSRVADKMAAKASNIAK